MKNLLILAIVLTLIGCGGSDSIDAIDEIEEPVAPIEKVSNLGQNINSLGYYDNGTIFGGHSVVGVKYIFSISGDGSIDKNDVVTQEFTDVANILMGGSMAEIGEYGVNEDGTTLSQHWNLTNQSLIFEYVEPLTEHCVLVRNNTELLAFCNSED